MSPRPCGANAGNKAAPTCDSNHRGLITYIEGATGVKDTLEVCAKDVSDSYAWRTLY
jgi:hypothetical protein